MKNRASCFFITGDAAAQKTWQTQSKAGIYIGSLGHEVHTPDGDPLAFIGYIGVQLLY